MMNRMQSILQGFGKGSEVWASWREAGRKKGHRTCASAEKGREETSSKGKTLAEAQR